VAGNFYLPGMEKGDRIMAALLVLLLVLVLFGAGFAVKVLWYLALASLVLWLIGFVARGPEARWYRW
jgi:hypothetical protein